MAVNEIVQEVVEICEYLLSYIWFLGSHPLQLNQENLALSPAPPMSYPEWFGFCSFPILHSTNILDCLINRSPVVCVSSLHLNTIIRKQLKNWEAKLKALNTHYNNSFHTGEQVVTCLFTRVICGESHKVNQLRWTKFGHHKLVHPSTSWSLPLKRMDFRFTLVDSTALINVEDSCKRAFR